MKHKSDGPSQETFVNEGDLGFLEALAGWLDVKPSGLQVARASGGHSIETYIVVGGDRRLVVRCSPRGVVLPTAHDVDREFRFLQALQGTGLPVPEPLLYSSAGRGVAGWYAMTFIDGVIISGKDLAGCYATDPNDRTAASYRVIEAMAQLHSVDWEERGLRVWLRPGSFVDRQLKRWSSQFERSLTAVGLDEDLIDGIRDVAGWLREHKPGQERFSVVHGDYKLNNIVLSREAPSVVRGILDWEMSSLGDPLMDLGWFLSFWEETDDPVIPFETFSGVTRLNGFVKRRELVERYCECVGESLGNITYYMVFARWKWMIIAVGLLVRRAQEAEGGCGVSESLPELQVVVPPILELCRSEMYG